MIIAKNIFVANLPGKRLENTRIIDAQTYADDYVYANCLHT